MRKILRTKIFTNPHQDNNHEFPCGDHSCFPAPPISNSKRVKILSNNWDARNNSTHIAAILHPENYLNSPCKWNQNNRGGSAKVTRKRCCLSPNNCYCLDKDIKPSILSRPKQCIQRFENLEKDFCEIDDLTRKSLACLCGLLDKDIKNDDKYYFKSKVCDHPVEERDNYIAGHNNEVVHLNKDNIGLEKTEQRKAAEQFSNDEREEYLRKLREYQENQYFEEALLNDSDEEYQNNYEEDYGGSGGVATILGTKSSYPESASTNHVTEANFQSEGNIQNGVNLADFRRKHYFETHGVPEDDANVYVKKGSDQPDGHKCVHQFRLDKRLFPEPLNKDKFGRSICPICNKPMESSSVNLSKSTLSSGSKSAIQNFAKCYYDYGFVPKQIYLGDNRSRIEIKVSEDDIPKLDGVLQRMKKIRYWNTLALRQQRMKV